MQDLVPEVLQHLETLTQHIGRAAADILNSMKLRQLQAVLGKEPWGILRRNLAWGCLCV